MDWRGVVAAGGVALTLTSSTPAILPRCMLARPLAIIHRRHGDGEKAGVTIPRSGRDTGVPEVVTVQAHGQKPNRG